MSYRESVRGESFTFSDLREVLAKANEEKSGDELAGLAARSETERVAAKLALADIPLREFINTTVVDDAVTDALRAAHHATAFAEFASLTIGEFRELILTPTF